MIVCCGEALIDMLPVQTEGGRTAYLPCTGGAALNSATALGRLGCKASLLTGLSSDFHGRMLEERLHASEVDTTLVIRSDRPTTLAFVQLTDGQASYAFHDENTAGRMVEPEDLPLLPPEANALLCGGISLVTEPCADAYAALVEREHSHRTIMTDPNIRPDFIVDETRYRQRLDRILELSDIIKVSDEDLEWLVPETSSTAARVDRLPGSALVIVTEGGRRAVAYRADGSAVDVAAQKANVVDTVGAGDTFNAGFLCHMSRAGLLERDGLSQLTATDLQHTLEFAHKVAAIAVSRKGADPPWASELAGQ